MAEIKVNQIGRRISVPIIKGQEVSLKCVQFAQRNTYVRPIANDKENLRGRETFRLPINTLKPKTRK